MLFAGLHGIAMLALSGRSNLGEVSSGKIPSILVSSSWVGPLSPWSPGGTPSNPGEEPNLGRPAPGEEDRTWVRVPPPTRVRAPPLDAEVAFAAARRLADLVLPVRPPEPTASQAGHDRGGPGAAPEPSAQARAGARALAGRSRARRTGSWHGSPARKKGKARRRAPSRRAHTSRWRGACAGIVPRPRPTPAHRARSPARPRNVGEIGTSCELAASIWVPEVLCARDARSLGCSAGAPAPPAPVAPATNRRRSARRGSPPSRAPTAPCTRPMRSAPSTRPRSPPTRTRASSSRPTPIRAAPSQIRSACPASRAPADGRQIGFAEVLGPNGVGALPSAAGGQVLGAPRVVHDPTRDVFVSSSTYVRPGRRPPGPLHPCRRPPAARPAPRGPRRSRWLPRSSRGRAPSRPPSTSTRRPGASPSPGFSAAERLRDPLQPLRRSRPDLVARGHDRVSAAGGDLDGPSRAHPPRGDRPGLGRLRRLRAIEPGTSLRNIGCRRSIDGGVTWEPLTLLDEASYPAEDQILGVDHGRSAARSTSTRPPRQVYVAHRRSGARGTGDIALRSSTEQCTAGPAVLLNSNPGRDRAQFFPFVAVDRTTGAAHVVLRPGRRELGRHDRDRPHRVERSRRLLQPTCGDLGPPLHAGHGNDASRQNLGDRIGGVALAGELCSVFSMTATPPRFDEGQPSSTSLIAPNVHLDVLDELRASAAVRGRHPDRGHRVRRPRERAHRSGELVDVGVYLENYLANPISGRTTVSRITATLSTETPSVTIVRASAPTPISSPSAPSRATRRSSSGRPGTSFRERRST